MTEISIRLALPEDANDLLDFAARTYYETFAPMNTPENMHTYMTTAFNPSGFTAELQDVRAIFMLAEVDDRRVGYAKLLAGKVPECVTGPAPVELVRFYVDACWQGKGVASVLMAACLNEARQRGFRTLYLGVWEKNERAKAF